MMIDYTLCQLKLMRVDYSRPLCACQKGAFGPIHTSALAGWNNTCFPLHVTYLPRVSIHVNQSHCSTALRGARVICGEKPYHGMKTPPTSRSSHCFPAPSLPFPTGLPSERYLEGLGLPSIAPRFHRPYFPFLARAKPFSFHCSSNISFASENWWRAPDLISHFAAALIPGREESIVSQSLDPASSTIWLLPAWQAGQNSRTCLLVCLAAPQGQLEFWTSGTFLVNRKWLNPIFSVRSWTAAELSGFFRPSWRSHLPQTRSPFCAGLVAFPLKPRW